MIFYVSRGTNFLQTGVNSTNTKDIAPMLFQWHSLMIKTCIKKRSLIKFLYKIISCKFLRWKFQVLLGLFLGKVILVNFKSIPCTPSLTHLSLIYTAYIFTYSFIYFYHSFIHSFFSFKLKI